MRAPVLPKKLYRVAVVGGTTPRRYGAPSGGTYHRLADALGRKRDLERDGREVVIFECEPEWRPL
jgi:hypothetical protein